MKKIAFVFLSLFLATSCSYFPVQQTSQQAEQATSADLARVAFSELPGWEQDQQQEALLALQKSCNVFAKRDPNAIVNPAELGGANVAWQNACADILNFKGDAAQARVVLEKNFNAYRVDTPNGDVGLFTGYYETMLKGSRVKTARYNVPLYKRPADLVMVDLGQFREHLKGERIAGRVLDGNLKPYDDRAAIENGALNNKKLELVYVDDADAAFFLHIQGSGRVHFEDGTEMRIGYDGQNGHVYKAIGKELIARGALTPETTNLETIRAWLKAHPSEAVTLRQMNPSFIFFKELTDEGPLGAQGIALTPERSLAVDPRFVPYGAPIWLDIPHPTQPNASIRRLTVAQDTGGAIRGPVRGDFFWGAGNGAEQNAGMMKSRGRMWILLPKGLQNGGNAAFHVALPHK